MTRKPNPKDKHAVILFSDKNVERVIPDEFVAYEGEIVEWIIRDPNQTRIAFEGDSPLEWKSRMSTGRHKKITGTVQPHANRKTPYKYTVSDVQGNEIDPHIEVRK
jgi:hypothetical protein